MPLLKIREAALRLGVSRSYCYELAERRAIPVVMVGSAIRVPSDALEAWIEQHTELNQEAVSGRH